ncbi:MAG: SRPBCC family protein [Cytophagaceae bacterium]|jgi:ligand-binding SRPBCC domain-containing protein|nr:SRPBCC family protein [Cytophagaceae bacterium]
MYKLETVQRLPISLDTAWRFFSSPDNLKKITPEYMSFDILSGGDTDMYPGMMIKYKVTPLFNLPMTWVTEITHVQAPYYFVDEQRVGPYSIWHHQHKFKEIPGGIEMTDIVHYNPPFGIIGKLVHPFLVRPKLKEIFDYRFAILEKTFGKL